jgi:thiol peroxidase
MNPDFADGRHRVMLIVPSLDTPTCGMQTRTFNGEASDMAPQVEVLVISRDLPFAQARFCGAHGIDRVVPLSDFEHGEFGQSWGLFIQETALLARAVAGTDGTGTVTYREVVPNTPDEPASGPALEALAALLSAPE